MKKSRSLRLRELKADLHYYQQMVRVDVRSLKAGIRKCKEIGAKMRDLQNGQAVEHTLAHGQAGTDGVNNLEDCRCALCESTRVQPVPPAGKA